MLSLSDSACRIRHFSSHNSMIIYRAGYGLKNLSAQQLVDCDNGNDVRNIFSYTIATKSS